MDKIKLNSAAKINLTLDVLGKRPDGFHEVRMIMQTVSLFDSVELIPQKSGITVETNLDFLPTGRGNIAYKAAELFFSETGIDSGVHIIIDKKIPVAAGLAGGSGNAAAVLRGLNLMFGEIYTANQLADLSGKIGSDIPYCIHGGTMLAEGRGEILTPLPQIPKTLFLLAKPPVNVSTQWVYQSLDMSKVDEHPDTAGCIQALNHGDTSGIAVRMYNVLESVTVEKYKIIEQIKRKMINCGAMGSVMSGSGPTVIGMFGDDNTARSAEKEIRKLTDEVYLVHTI